MTPHPATTVSAADAKAEHRWFADEVEPHAAQLKSYLRRSFPSIEADDVVQESYLRILRRRATEPIDSVRAFLFQTARNLAFDLWRRKQINPVAGVPNVSALAVADGRPNGAEMLSRQEKVRLLALAIDSLPVRCREVFVLCRVQNLTQKEVASRLKLSPKTVEVQVRKGLQRCESFLRERGVRGVFNDV